MEENKEWEGLIMGQGKGDQKQDTESLLRVFGKWGAGGRGREVYPRSWETVFTH